MECDTHGERQTHEERQTNGDRQTHEEIKFQKAGPATEKLIHQRHWATN